MISDFLLLEEFFDGPETAQFYEDALKKYGVVPVQKAIKSGQLVCHKMQLGPNRGRLMVWLSDTARAL